MSYWLVYSRCYNLHFVKHRFWLAIQLQFFAESSLLIEKIKQLLTCSSRLLRNCLLSEVSLNKSENYRRIVFLEHFFLSDLVSNLLSYELWYWLCFNMCFCGLWVAMVGYLCKWQKIIRRVVIFFKGFYLGVWGLTSA